MRSLMMGVALLTAIGLTAAAPDPAAAGGQKTRFESLKVKRGGIAKGALKKAPRPGAANRVKNFFMRPLRGLKPINRKQHPFAPMKPGDIRVFAIEQSMGGGETHDGLLTQRVSDVRIQDGRLRAQVAQTWEFDGNSNTTLHVQDVTRDGMLMATAEKLDEAPKVPIRVDGLGLPSKLAAGKTWKNSMSYQLEGATVESHAEGRVIGRVRRAGPDRKVRDGVEIETVTHSTTTIGGTPHRTTTVHRAIYLKGLGEVESTTRTEGQAGSVTRRLVGFTPGGVPG